MLMTVEVCRVRMVEPVPTTSTATRVCAIATTQELTANWVKYKNTRGTTSKSTPSKSHCNVVHAARNITITTNTHADIYSETTNSVFVTLYGTNGVACDEYEIQGGVYLQRGQ